MAEDRTVLEHLLDGRDALVLEVERLNAALDELDSVIGRIGDGERRIAAASAPSRSRRAVDGPEQPVNPRPEVEALRRSATSARGRASGPRKSTSRRAAGAASGGAPKSIRVHVLEMLAAEQREFGLAEIIDRVHSAGIQAHDDAVRSITIKLMKDGKVERVGRGQYRLARRGSGTRVVSASTDAAYSDAPEVEMPPSPDTDAPADADAGAGSASASYSPPLNLGQPWDPPRG